MLSKKKKNISSVVKKGMCVGCGACVAACRYGSIKGMDFSGDSNVPIIESEKCVNCGLCRKACPALGIETGVKHNSLLGEINKIYLGHSKDFEIRNNSSSGGVATAISLFLLEKKYVDGVLCTIQEENNPLKNKIIIAQSREEVISAKGSKYSPASPCAELKNILNQKRKILFIGKGCDIEGLERLKGIFPDLEDKIILSIGIFCDHEPTRSATIHLLKSNNINLADVRKILYRSNGWPGYLLILLKSGGEKRIPYQVAWPQFLGKSEFVLPRCRLCFKGLAELADISLGDPWALQKSLEPKGSSLIITRTENGERIIKQAEEAGFIEIEEIKQNVLIDSQKSIFSRKHKIETLVKVLDKIRKSPSLYKGDYLEKNWKLVNFIYKLISLPGFIKKLFRKLFS